MIHPILIQTAPHNEYIVICTEKVVMHDRLVKYRKTYINTNIKACNFDTFLCFDNLLTNTII